jgi:uncharacterized protein YjgD (DUF1641 family)
MSNKNISSDSLTVDTINSKIAEYRKTIDTARQAIAELKKSPAFHEALNAYKKAYHAENKKNMALGKQVAQLIARGDFEAIKKLSI